MARGVTRTVLTPHPPVLGGKPAIARTSDYLESCHGGCGGRRRIQNALDQPDYYCPIVRGELQKLEIRMASARELPKGESACTTIVIARDGDGWVLMDMDMYG